MEDGRFVWHQFDLLIWEIFRKIRAQGAWLVLIGEHMALEI